MIPFNAEALDWLASSTKIARASLQISELAGANSSSVYAVANANKPCARQFVLRVFNDEQWLNDEPDLAIHEAAALQEAKLCAANSPDLIAFEANDKGFGGPVVLMSRLSGHVELRPDDLSNWCAQLAETLAQIHAHDAKGFDWNTTSWIDAENLRVPKWTAQPQLWQRAIGFWQAGPPAEKIVFLHRDFHPCNVLWKNGVISGVVDWVNACRGPRGVDVAHCRANLAILFGVETADAFKNAYLDIAGGAHHPYWDVASILDMSLPEPEFYHPWSEFGLPKRSVGEMMRRGETYLQSVMESVAGIGDGGKFRQSGQIS